MTHHHHTPPQCSSQCPHFKHEDIKGFGWCKAAEADTYTDMQCIFCTNPPTVRQTAALLSQYQKWRLSTRGKHPDPWLIDIAIDSAIQKLRKQLKDKDK